MLKISLLVINNVAMSLYDIKSLLLHFPTFLCPHFIPTSLPPTPFPTLAPPTQVYCPSDDAVPR